MFTYQLSLQTSEALRWSRNPCSQAVFLLVHTFAIKNTKFSNWYVTCDRYIIKYKRMTSNHLRECLACPEEWRSWAPLLVCGTPRTLRRDGSDVFDVRRVFFTFYGKADAWTDFQFNIDSFTWWGKCRQTVEDVGKVLKRQHSARCPAFSPLRRRGWKYYFGEFRRISTLLYGSCP